MTLGSWAIISEPSVLGLIPLFLYIVLALKIKGSPFLPLAISIAVGCLMSGNGAIGFGKSLFSTMSTSLGGIALGALLGGGLSAVMNSTGVTSALCQYIVDFFHVNTRKKALWVIIALVFVLSLTMGSATGAVLVCAPFLISIAAKFSIRPVTVTTIAMIGGYGAMTLSPFNAGNITAMELTGVTFPQLLLWSAGPYVVFTLIIGIVLGFYLDKKLQKVEGEEFYSPEDGGSDKEITPDAKRGAIAFLIGFIGCVVYMIIFKGGIPFTYFYMIFLSIVMAIFSKQNLSKMFDNFVSGCGRTVSLFFMLVFIQVLLNTVNVMGGFDALGELCAGFIGETGSKSMLMLVGTLFGLFGINGSTAAQMVVIDGVFKTMITAAGISGGMWSMVLMMGSMPSNFLYPGTTQFSIMGICRCNDFKTVMKMSWIACAIQTVIAILYCLIIPILF